MTPDDRTPLHFRLFNEMAIIVQLSTAVLERHLPAGLLEGHFRVLNHLVRVGDGRAMLDMARAFQTPKTTITHQVGVLARRGLVEVRPNPRDGRSKCVWTTPAGRALREAVAAEVARAAASWEEALPAAEVADLVPRLERIRRFLDSEREGRPDGPDGDGRASE